MAQARVQELETSLNRTARKPGGKPKEMALADAQKAVASLSTMGLNLIRSNIELLRRLGADLQQPDADADALMMDAYRLSVEMAEVASFFQMNGVAEVAMNFNELLFRMRENGQLHHASYAVHVEALRIAHSAQGSNPEDTARLTAHLRKVVEKLPDPDAELTQ